MSQSVIKTSDILLPPGVKTAVINWTLDGRQINLFHLTFNYKIHKPIGWIGEISQALW